MIFVLDDESLKEEEEVSGYKVEEESQRRVPADLLMNEVEEALSTKLTWKSLSRVSSDTHTYKLIKIFGS